MQQGGGYPYSSSPHFLISSESISMLAQSFCFLFPPTLFLGPAGISCVGFSHPPRVCPGLFYQGACRVGLTHVIPLVGTLVCTQQVAHSCQLPLGATHPMQDLLLQSQPLPSGLRLSCLQALAPAIKIRRCCRDSPRTGSSTSGLKIGFLPSDVYFIHVAMV